MNDIVALSLEFAAMAVRARRAEEEVIALRGRVEELTPKPSEPIPDPTSVAEEVPVNG